MKDSDQHTLTSDPNVVVTMWEDDDETVTIFTWGAGIKLTGEAAVEVAHIILGVDTRDD